MFLLVRARPVFRPTLRSLITDCSKTFTSRAHTTYPSDIRSKILFSGNNTSRSHQFLSHQVRLSSSNAPDRKEEAAKEEGSLTKDSQPSNPDNAGVDCNAVGIEPEITTNITTNSGLKWDLVSHETINPVITGAILPFTQLNFLQQLVFPYTYTLMYYLDYLTSIMPWWAAIMTTTATARLLFFPLVVKQNIVGIKANNVLSETQKIQKQLQEATITGDTYNQAIAKTKLKYIYDQHGITMKDRLLPVLFQAPLYMSLFFLLRNLVNIPVESLKTGGILWFTDLTAPDPYCILPLITSCTMFVLLEFGLEGGANPKLVTPVMRYIMRGMPVVIFALTYSFPAATLLFWSTSNFFTMSYALIMKTAIVKRIFNIPARRQVNLEDLPMTSMSFKSQIKSAMDRAQSTRTSVDVRRLDDIAFRKAGIGPLRKTYKEPPSAQGLN